MLTLHDGQFDAGSSHQGESFKTTVKTDAGSKAEFKESFTMNKPENMDVVRISLYDSNVTIDELLGSVDLDLKTIPLGRHVDREVTVVKGGKETGKIDLKIKMQP
mmetsp:Transcript_18939/g.52110  ORF Transcript_18939/g.52110 Transcript_18939/m.52110 type:complete len:105 (+) Transcript_18939:392-706(+)